MAGDAWAPFSNLNGAVKPYRDATWVPSPYDLHVRDCWAGLVKAVEGELGVTAYVARRVDGLERPGGAAAGAAGVAQVGGGLVLKGDADGVVALEGHAGPGADRGHGGREAGVAEAGVEAGNSTAQNDEAGEVARLDSPHEEGSGEVPDGA